jgi:inositol-hexakisphosphate kinase
MSSSPSAPQNASPLVRSESELSSDASKVNHHALAPIPPTLSPAITPSQSLPPSLRSENLPLRSSTVRTYHDQLPQLSERESIFATHYLVNDSDSATTTPRLPPVSKSKNDIEHLQQDVASRLEVLPLLSSQATTSALLSRQQRHTATITPLASSTQLSSSGIGSRGDTSSNTHQNTYSLGKGDDAVGVTPPQHLESIQQKPPSIRREPSSRYPSSKSARPGLSLRMSATWAQPEVSAANGTSVVAEEPGTGLDVDTANKRKRSSSRGRVTEQIEATLTSEEPQSISRSRKASHYLGLFKENTEQRKGNDKSRERSKSVRVSGVWEDTWVTDPQEGKDDIKDVADHSVEALSQPNLPTSTYELDIPGPLEDNYNRPKSSRNSSSTQLSPSPLTDISNKPKYGRVATKNDLSRSVESVEWVSSQSSQGSLPLRLLEEIRNFHSLSSSSRIEQAKFFRTDQTEQQYTSSGSTDATNRHGKDHGCDGSLPDRSVQEDKADTTVEENEYESDKEHISSATYYPHQAPSPDVLDDTDPDLNSPMESSDDAVKGAESSSISSIDEYHPDQAAEFSDALQSHEAIEWAQDTTKSRAPSERLRIGKPDSNVSSASESEYESLDDPVRSDKGEDSGVTDGGEITPTATSSNRGPLVKSRFRSKPLRAVKLVPYEHQVGGHTNVYSFSKQAICKELNSRENEFYEIIEKKHPELLKFLPRCVVP